MKVVALCMLLVLGISVAKAQKPKCVPTTTPPRDDTVRLKLVTSIAETRYSVEYGAKVLRLSLSLNYQNVGTRPILLDKKSSLIYRQLVSKNFRAVSACKYLQDISSHFIGGELLRASAPERSEFITLNPGESVDLKDEVMFRLYDGSKDTKDDLHPGNYVLQVRVAAWFYAADPAEWERKWGNEAYVWSGNITSEPMPFAVQKYKIDPARAIPVPTN